MEQGTTPANETSRLEVLHSLDLLDTKPEERFDRLTRLARRLFNVPIALVSLVDENRQWFKACVPLDTRETSRDISFCGHAILGDGIFLIPDATRDPRFADNPLVLGAPHIRFYAGCPLRLMNHRLGTLCLIDRKPRKLSKHHLECLRDLAEMAEQELAAMLMATMDELTDLSNRRGFMMLAKHSLSLCSRRNEKASVIYLDLDGFKAINDTYGHAEGDRALLTFAEQMKIAFRDSDVLARLGGDEFAVLLSHQGVEAAEVALARFGQLLASSSEEANRGYAITFSSGIMTFDPQRHGNITDLLAEADRRMYERKRARRAAVESRSL